MKRAAVVLVAALASTLLSGCDADGSPPAATPLPVSAQIDYVGYSFEIDTDGLPKGAFRPRPRDIDVIYRDMRTGNLESVRGVDSNWSILFTKPNFGRGFMSAIAHGGGTIVCSLEVSYADASGFTFHDQGPHRCCSAKGSSIRAL
ncbi:MAG: hypothetical protein M3273_01550 [Actinomycetota bacterium]|nr:hypothetical protein [Actinomycetota bacterium]